MKKLLLLFIIFTSCQKSKTSTESLKNFSDSLEIEMKARKMTDSIINQSGKQRLLDTTGMYNCPIKIISAKFITQEYSNYKSVKLVYKNISAKKVNAIKFEWYGENSFNEPAEMPGSTFEGIGGGFTEDLLSPGKTDSGVWDILSKDGKKIIAARAYQVAYSDGTTWELKH